MKNIFKFLGIALMACSLTMVACNKDDDKKSDTTNPSNPTDTTDPGDDTTHQGEGSYLIGFGQTQCNFNYTEAVTDGTNFMFLGATGLDMRDTSLVYPYAVIRFGKIGNSVKLVDEIKDATKYSYYVDGDENLWLFYCAYADIDSTFQPRYLLDGNKISCQDALIMYNYTAYEDILASLLAYDDLTLDDWETLSDEERETYSRNAAQQLFQDQEHNISGLTVIMDEYPFTPANK